MSIREEITAAVHSACEEIGQSVPVAEKIIAWLESISSGNSSLDDGESVKRHLDLLFDTIAVDVNDYTEE